MRSLERWPSAPMSRSTQWRKSTNSDDNWYINVNYEVLQLLSKELEEHKTINNKDGIEWSLHAGCRPCTKATCESVWERKIQKCDQCQRSYNPTPKGMHLSASQARPMLTTGVVRSGLASVTHDKIRVKSSCFQQMMLSSWHPINNKYKIALTVWCSRIMMQMARNMELSKWQMKLCSATA
mgnify:CR=1 FL=1